MNKRPDSLRYALLLVLVGTAGAEDPTPPKPITHLEIDPTLLISLQECRRITKAIGPQLYPGWDFQATPVLFYRPKIQEVLLNFPHKPVGFVEYSGPKLLGQEVIFVRNGKTTFDIDDQNTSTTIDGIPVLVVADPYSRMRNQLSFVLRDMAKDAAAKWLENWQFIPSPYAEVEMILHEAFHVYQKKQAPDKFADESIVASYPLLNPVNNALHALEGHLLKESLLAANQSARLDMVKDFVAVRSYRQARLEDGWVAYENLNEYVEGTAKYVEYKFLTLGENLEPGREMYYRTGFQGYRDVLSRRFRDKVEDMVRIVGVTDDRMGNRFGSGPLRFRLYELGACQALLLDEVMPQWKEKIFQKNVFLCDLLKEAVQLPADELSRRVEKAKARHDFDKIYATKLEFERTGRKRVQEKLEAILQTKQTLVKISYAGFAENLRMSYTPFGVTQVGKGQAIYDMVPLTVRFKTGVELRFKQVVPVLIDKEKKLLTFAVATPAAKLIAAAPGGLDVDEFALTGGNADAGLEAGAVLIQLR